MAKDLTTATRAGSNVNPTDKEVLVVTKPAAAAALAKDPDLELYEAVIESPRTGSRTSDENSAFTQFKNFVARMLKVALSKGHTQVRVGRLIQGAVDAKIFDEVQPPDQRYRRGYNYFTQQKKSLPDGWVVQSINGKNCCVHVKK